MLVVTALATVFLRDLFALIMVFGIYSLLSASFFLNLSAPDVALTESAIGAGITPILMLGTLALTRKAQAPVVEKSKKKTLLPLIVVVVTGAALVYATLDVPYFGTPDAPAHNHVAPHYIDNSYEEIHIPNIVTSVLASYRGYDTLGETFVIFTAGLGVLALLGGLIPTRAEDYVEFSDTASLRRHHILHVISKILIPVILLFGLYVQFHGDYSPGGGFQAGVIFAVAFILYAMVFGLSTAHKVISPGFLKWGMLCGVLIYGGTGIVSLLKGANYLDYGVLAHDPVHGQHYGIIIVELGVGICVASVMLSIFYTFAARTRHAAEEAS